MKILQVIPYFFISWAGGGPVPLIYNLSKSLTARGHQVTIFTTDTFNKTRRLNDRNKVMDINGIKVCEFKSLGNRLGQRYNICISPAMIPAMSAQIAGFDVVHLHEYRTFQNIVAHHYARKHSIPYVLQAHGSLPRMVSRQLMKKLFDGLWGNRLLQDAARVIAVTDTEAGQYRSMGVSEDRIEIIPHGLDLSEFDNLPERGEFRKKYDLANDLRIVLYLGRIHEIKGLDLLVRAFAGLSGPLRDIKLVITGPDYGYLPALKRLTAGLAIDDKVLFTGPLYGWEKLAAYVDADVYVLPSSYEIFSITVLEACACGTPVVVTDRCGLADAIDGRAGLVVPYDEAQLKDALQHLLHDDEKRRHFGQGGKSLVRERYDWVKIAEQVERVYQSVIQ